MKILVPTDFSQPSKVAVLYAVRLAKKLKAEIILLTVLNVNTSAASSIKWNKLGEELIKIAKQDADQLMQEIREQIKGALKISFQHITGYPVEDMVDTFVVESGIDLIVMGTKGATGLKKVLIGTNAAAVINSSSRPVIAVPGETEFKRINKIVYASDMTDIQKEIKALSLFAKLFNAAIQVLHVIPSDSAKRMNIKKVTADLVRQAKYPKISFHVSENDSVADAVDEFVAIEKAQMLAMFTHRLDFYEKLFGKSITRQLAFHTRVPLLTFNKTMLQ